MSFYYLDSNNQAQGPYELGIIQNFLEKGRICLTTLVVQPGENQWSPLREVLKTDSLRSVAHSKYYRLSTTSRLQIKSIPVVKKNDKIVLLQEYATTADGSKKKILVEGENNPTTPIKAIEAFIAAQRQTVDLAKIKYDEELALLEKAEKMLQESLEKEPRASLEIL